MFACVSSNTPQIPYKQRALILQAGEHLEHIHGNDRIQIFTTDGEFITSWGASVVRTGLGEFDGPAVVAFDSNGNVDVTDSGNQRVQKFTSDGTFITQWGEEGEGDGQFSIPEGLAIDSLSGKVYVSDQATITYRYLFLHQDK